VSLDPAADLVLGAARLGSDADAHALQWQPGGDRHPGTPLGSPLLSRQVPVGVEEAVQDVIVGADLLQQDDLGLLLGDPGLHTAAEGGPDAVDVDGGDAEHASILPQPTDTADPGVKKPGALVRTITGGLGYCI